jgi:hypothetical protein
LVLDTPSRIPIWSWKCSIFGLFKARRSEPEFEALKYLEETAFFIGNIREGMVGSHSSLVGFRSICFDITAWN